MGMALGGKKKKKRKVKSGKERVLCVAWDVVHRLPVFKGCCWIGLVCFGYCTHDHLGRSITILLCIIYENRSMDDNFVGWLFDIIIS